MAAKRGNWAATSACPYPDQALAGWLFNYARRNHWRVRNMMAEKDLTQEGFEVYARCYLRYGDKGFSAPLFMALFMRAFGNHLNDLSDKATYWRTYEVTEADITPTSSEEPTPIYRLQEAEAASDLQGVLMVIAEAPNEGVRQILATFMSIAPPIYQRVVKKGETPNQFLCRILGLDPVVGRDLIRQAKDYLYGHLTTA